MTDFVRTDTDDAVRVITLTRTDKKNALTQAMYSALTEALQQASADDAIRAVLLQGDENVFCAGNDLQDFLSLSEIGPDSPILRFLMTLLHFEKPLLAAVAGPAVGIGTTVLLHCDWVVAHDNARFQLPFVALGLCAEAGSSALLARRVGQANANEWLLTGRPYNAEQALSQGLINKTVSQDVCAAGLKQAKTIASLPCKAVMTTKALIRKPYLAEAEQAIHEEAAQFVQLLKGDECKAAISAFFNQR